jgi:hypothetical protein
MEKGYATQIVRVNLSPAAQQDAAILGLLTVDYPHRVQVFDTPPATQGALLEQVVGLLFIPRS